MTFGKFAMVLTPRIRSCQVLAVRAWASGAPSIVCASSNTKNSAPVRNAAVICLRSSSGSGTQFIGSAAEPV